MIDFSTLKLRKEEVMTIFRIAERAANACARMDPDPLWLGGKNDFAGLVMDLEACHALHCRLELNRLEDATDDDFMHDVMGIYHHFSRTTGTLQDCFMPRYASSNWR